MTARPFAPCVCWSCRKVASRNVDADLPKGWSASPDSSASWCNQCAANVASRVEGFVAIPKPQTREIAIMFAQGHVVIAEAEARALVDTISGALAILAAEHPAQEIQTQGAA